MSVRGCALEPSTGQGHPAAVIPCRTAGNLTQAKLTLSAAFKFDRTNPRRAPFVSEIAKGTQKVSRCPSGAADSRSG